MPKTVYIANLDAHTARLESKINGLQNKTVSAGQKMEAAFKRVGGAMIAAFSAGVIARYGKEMVDLGIKVVNVRRAFERLDDPSLLRNLRKATRNTIDDLNLMSSANFANKMGIPGKLLAKGMEFAGLVALETGQSIEYMMDSFVTGTARESSRIIDNLTISQIELNAEIKKTGDFQTALSNIFDRRLPKMRGSIDETALATAQLNTELENQKIMIGESLVPVWNTFIAGVAGAIDVMQDMSGLSFGKKLAEQDKAMRDLVKERTDSMFEILGVNKNLVQGNFEKIKQEEKITEEKNKQVEKTKTELELLKERLDIARGELQRKIVEHRGSMVDPFNMGGGKSLTPGGLKEAVKPIADLGVSLDQAQSPMTALVSLSNQMASNFSFAGHTFVGQLSQAIAMVDSISNIILTVASLFGGGGGFGIGGLLSLIGLEKGGRVTNKFGNVSLGNIPSFAMGGSYSTPSFSGPFAGGYPVMVHKNETLDVYNAGGTSRMERKLDGIKNAILTSNVHLSRKGKGGEVINVNVDGEHLFTINTKRGNRAGRANVNTGEMI